MLNQNSQPNYQITDISTPSKFQAWKSQYEVNSMAPEKINYYPNPSIQNMVNNQ